MNKTSLFTVLGLLLVGFLQQAAGNNHSSVLTNVPEAIIDGYVILYELDIPLDAGFRGGSPIPYTIDNSASAPDFDRVAYYLKLTNGNDAKWIYASMDAFTVDAVKLGIPHSSNNPVVHQQNVRNMHVASNVHGVVTGTFIDTGHIEMWPSHYNKIDTHGVFAASHDLYDWGDGGATTQSGYGSFQIHNPMARQTLLAYNGWGIVDGAHDDVGIGSQPSDQPDWTNASNAGDFTERKLIILVRPRAHDVSFTELPRDRQLFSRNLATNTAMVPITGTESFGNYDRIVLRVFRNGSLHSETSQDLSYSNGSASFSFANTIAAELASYDFELLLDKDGNLTSVERVQDVVAGDAYLVYGQSNASAMSYHPSDRSANEYAGVFLRTFGQNGNNASRAQNILYWAEAEGDGDENNPASIGQWAMVLGGSLIESEQVPIAILNGGRAGHAIDQLQKDRENPDALNDSGGIRRPYNRLRYRAIQAGIADTARALFYYQGEQDRNDPKLHADGYATLREDWEADYPGLERFYVTQVRPGCGVQDYHTGLRDAQRRFADTYPNTSVMATNGIPNHDGCHFAFTGGYEELGLQYFRQVARDLYGAQDEPNIDPLNPAFVTFTDSSRTELKLVFRNAGATVNFPADAVNHFVLTGTSAAITGRSVSGHTVTFTLNGPTGPDAALEYRSHFGANDWVTNGNGVGLLTFVEPIQFIEAPLVGFNSPPTSREANVGETIMIQAAAETTAETPVERMVLYANGLPQFETSETSLSTTWTPSAPGTYRLTIRVYDTDGEFHDDSIAVLVNSPSSPGGVSNGLRVWLRAEQGVTLDASRTIHQWNDQSGHGFHVTQSSSTARPSFGNGLYGLGAGVQFSGNQFLTSTEGMPTGDYTKIVRFTLTNGSSTFLHNLVSSAHAGSSSARDHSLYLPNLRPTLGHRSNFAQIPDPVPLHKPLVLIGDYTASTRLGNLYLNGEWGTTGTAGGPNTKTSFQLGAYASDFFLHGSIAEVMIYDRVLTSNERQSITTYLDTKYLTPYELWQRQFSLSGADGAPGSDPDGDGLANAIEYALDLNPTVAGSGEGRVPHISQNGSAFDVVYTRATDRPDANIQLERSTDLEEWTPVADETIRSNENLEVQRYIEKMTNENESLFFRLRVKVPGPIGTGFGDTSEAFTEVIATTDLPFITSQPKNVSVAEGQPATFEVTFNGTNPTYQWERSTDRGTTWNPISGATGSNYSTPPATFAMDGSRYRVIIHDDGLSVSSLSAILTLTGGAAFSEAEFQFSMVGVELGNYQILSSERFRSNGNEGTWGYERTSSDTATLTLNYDNGETEEFALMFSDSNTVMISGERVALEFDFFGLQPSDTTGRSSFWLGDFDQRYFDDNLRRGWILHDEHGWLYAVGKGYADGIWFWDHVQEDWLWTRAAIYPFFFSDGRMAWLYYGRDRKPLNRRFFYSYEEANIGWFDVDR